MYLSFMVRIFSLMLVLFYVCIKVMVIPQQAEVAQGVPGRLRPRIFSTIRVVDPQPYAPTPFTPGEIPGTHFQRLSRPQGTWFRRGEPLKKSPVTPPVIDPETVRLVVQCLNHYATRGPCYIYINSTNIPPIMIINRIYKNQYLLSL